MAGKGDGYRPVNLIKYDKGWARIKGKCPKCQNEWEGKCLLPETVKCNYVIKGANECTT